MNLQQRIFSSTVALATIATLVITVGCAHLDTTVKPSNHGVERANKALRSSLIPAMTSAGDSLGLSIQPENVTVAWNDNELFALGKTAQLDLSDEQLAAGIVTGIIYVPNELDDGSPGGFYATKVTIDPTSNEGSALLIDTNGREVARVPASRVLEEGESPRPEGLPEMVERGERPRICSSNFLTREKKKRKKILVYYTKEDENKLVGVCVKIKVRVTTESF